MSKKPRRRRNIILAVIASVVVVCVMCVAVGILSRSTDETGPVVAVATDTSQPVEVIETMDIVDQPTASPLPTYTQYLTYIPKVHQVITATITPTQEPIATVIPTNTQPPPPKPTATPKPADTGCPNGCTAQKPGCDIKGNISSSGEKIYHVPGGAFYNQTKISPSKGERWFCTGAEAMANGWRKSKR